MKRPRAIRLTGDAERQRLEHQRAIVDLQKELEDNPPGDGRYLGRQTLGASQQYVPNARAKRFAGEIAGGGGGGGGGGGAATGAAAGAGGNSGEAIKFHGSANVGTLTGGAWVQGQGGAGGVSVQSGFPGGDSSLTINGVTYTAKGGGGGAGMASTTGTANAQPSAGATPTTAYDGHSQGIGGTGAVVAGAAWWSGNGGSSSLGVGGASVGGANNGKDGQGYGGGGGGAAATTTGKAGGKGANGGGYVDEWS